MRAQPQRTTSRPGTSGLSSTALFGSIGPNDFSHLSILGVGSNRDVSSIANVPLTGLCRCS